MTGADTPPSDDTKYTITRKDENGTTLSQVTVNEGDTPSYTYSVTDTAEWDYTFIGWAERVNVTVLNSLNIHEGSSYHQTNTILVIK